MKNLEKFAELKKRTKSERMIAIVGMIEYEQIADIGTDHGYIPIFACLSGYVKSAIGCDILPGPLSTAEKNIKEYNLQDHISLRLGNGLTPLKIGEADTIIITGMGGKTIIDILNMKQNNRYVAKTAKQLILSPQSSVPSVRRIVHDFGFIIKNEIMMKENNRYYNILNCVVGSETYSPEEYLLGKILIQEKSDYFVEYLQSEIMHIKKILDKPIDSKKRKELESLLNIYIRNM